MQNHHNNFKPLDPGRINARDDIELKYWCGEFQCAEAELEAAVASAGEHVTAVREHLRARLKTGS